jgi:hypothetical protein
MTMENQNNKSAPRYEYRTFGRDLSGIRHKMTSLSGPVPEAVKQRSSREIYILTRTNETGNCKIRDDLLDIKSLIQSTRDLEQWDVVFKSSFPVSKKVLINEVFPMLWTRAPLLGKAQFSKDEFLELVQAHPDLQEVRVDKQRYGYFVNETICEYAEVYVNGALVQTASAESENPELLLQTASIIGIEDYENINYQQAIKRILGWSEMIIH